MSSFGQTPEPGADLKARVQQLFEQARWQQVAEACRAVPQPDVDLRYYCGSALAQLGRWDDAREALLAGHQLAPRDKRFPIELAGIAFKQKRYAAAASWLHHALHLDPADGYANDFLGTVYFLEGNLEAALKYWNRAYKPQISAVRPEHPLQIRPALLDRALTFARGETLILPDFMTSRSRVGGLGVFVEPDLQLAARDDSKFDVVLNLQERNGFGASKWAALVSTFSGIAYQTVYPEYFNFHRSAINFTSLVRWDAQKRRLAAAVSGPLHDNPKRRYRLGVDLRNENWAIRDSFTGVAPLLGAANLRREAGSAEIISIENGLWDWSTGVEVSHRDYRSVDLGTALTPQRLASGTQLKELGRIHYDLWRDPDRRLIIHSAAEAQVARIWTQNAQIYSKLRGSLEAQWFPKAQGDDYATHLQIRGGGAAGSVPFDELYMLGLERDNDLWLRAHIGTRDGRKGSAPLGTQFVLTNFDVDKNVHSNGLIAVKLSPFLDTGEMSGSSTLNSHEYLWDAGLQLKFRVLGQSLIFTWGKDLRTGNNAWYFSSVR